MRGVIRGYQNRVISNKEQREPNRFLLKISNQSAFNFLMKYLAKSEYISLQYSSGLTFGANAKDSSTYISSCTLLSSFLTSLTIFLQNSWLWLEKVYRLILVSICITQSLPVSSSDNRDRYLRIFRVYALGRSWLCLVASMITSGFLHRDLILKKELKMDQYSVELRILNNAMIEMAGHRILHSTQQVLVSNMVSSFFSSTIMLISLFWQMRSSSLVKYSNSSIWFSASISSLFFKRCSSRASDPLSFNSLLSPVSTYALQFSIICWYYSLFQNVSLVIESQREVEESWAPERRSTLKFFLIRLSDLLKERNQSASLNCPESRECLSLGLFFSSLEYLLGNSMFSLVSSVGVWYFSLCSKGVSRFYRLLTRLMKGQGIISISESSQSSVCLGAWASQQGQSQFSPFRNKLSIRRGDISYQYYVYGGQDR